jgi:hypothetical protein
MLRHRRPPIPTHCAATGAAQAATSAAPPPIQSQALRCGCFAAAADWYTNTSNTESRRRLCVGLPSDSHCCSPPAAPAAPAPPFFFFFRFLPRCSTGASSSCCRRASAFIALGCALLAPSAAALPPPSSSLSLLSAACGAARGARRLRAGGSWAAGLAEAPACPAAARPPGRRRPRPARALRPVAPQQAAAHPPAHLLRRRARPLVQAAPAGQARRLQPRPLALLLRRQRLVQPPLQPLVEPCCGLHALRGGRAGRQAPALSAGGRRGRAAGLKAAGVRRPPPAGRAAQRLTLEWGTYLAPRPSLRGGGRQQRWQVLARPQRCLRARLGALPGRRGGLSQLRPGPGELCRPAGAGVVQRVLRRDAQPAGDLAGGVDRQGPLPRTIAGPPGRRGSAHHFQREARWHHLHLLVRHRALLAARSAQTGPMRTEQAPGGRC